MTQQKKTPMRRCLGCMESFPKKELIRVVRSPEGEISLDPTGKKAGRGAYVCRRGECLRKAIKQRQLERQLQSSMSEAVHDALLAEMEKLSAEEKEWTAES